jgi:hypothetical protein
VPFNSFAEYAPIEAVCVPSEDPETVAA